MTAIITVAIVFAFAVVVLAIYSADIKKKKSEGIFVEVPEGEMHLVRSSDGKITKEKGKYRRYKGDNVIALRGSDTRFVITLDDCFVTVAPYADAAMIKVNVKACLEITDSEKIFTKVIDLMAYLRSCVERVVKEAVIHTGLEDLLVSGISEVVANDAIAEKASLFTEVGVSLKGFRISDVRDAYGQKNVFAMRRSLAEKRKKDKGNPHYPSLEEVVNSELDSFLKDDPYPIVMNG